jgi:hypothetical protein
VARGIQPGAGKIGGSDRLGLGILKPALYFYDFAVDGGAISTITLRGDGPLPNGAVVVDSTLLVDTVLAGATATMALTTGETAADVQAAVVVTGAPYSTVGAKKGSALTFGGAPKLLTADRSPAAVIATAAVTAGKFRLLLWFYEVALNP